MKQYFKLIFIFLFAILSIPSICQEITLTQQIKAKQCLTNFNQFLSDYCNGKAESRILLEDLMETRSNKVCNDLSDDEMIEFNEYLNLILQQKPTISFSEIPPKEQWQVAFRDDGWLGIVVKVNKKVNNADKVNYFIVNPTNNKIVNIYKTLPGFLSYQKLADAPQSDNQISEEIKVSESQITEETKVEDYDGNVYNTMTIGTQIWMVENLKTTHYSDGTPIPNVSDKEEWSELKTGAYCNYDNNTSNADIYGRIYNWYTVNNSNLCPTGWHVPTNAEWGTLLETIGVDHFEANNSQGCWGSCGQLKEIGNKHWSVPNTGATNSSGFTALPGGERIYGEFYSIGQLGVWWNSWEDHSNDAYTRTLSYNSSCISNAVVLKQSGLSVRCIKD